MSRMFVVTSWNPRENFDCEKKGWRQRSRRCVVEEEKEEESLYYLDSLNQNSHENQLDSNFFAVAAASASPSLHEIWEDVTHLSLSLPLIIP